MKVTLKGKEYSINAAVLKESEHAPDFILKDSKGSPVKLEDLLGEVLLISTFPDITTKTCSKQTEKFNELAKTLNDTKILSVSTNTADEQEEWSKSKGMNTLLLQDEDRSFGKAYGLYIEELDKLARAVFVLNRNGQVVHREIVDEMTQEPDYEEAVAAARHEESEV